LKKQQAVFVVTTYDGQNEATQKTNPLRSNISALKAVNAIVEKLYADLQKTDDKGQAVISSLLKAELLKNLSKEPNSYTLYVKSVATAGTNKQTKNLFTGTKLYHSGGVIISYILFDNSGNAIAANTLHQYDGFVKIRSRDGTLTSQ